MGGNVWRPTHLTAEQMEERRLVAATLLRQGPPRCAGLLSLIPRVVQSRSVTVSDLASPQRARLGAASSALPRRSTLCPCRRTRTRPPSSRCASRAHIGQGTPHRGRLRPTAGSGFRPWERSRSEVAQSSAGSLPSAHGHVPVWSSPCLLLNDPEFARLNQGSPACGGSPPEAARNYTECRR